ncbi:MAG TPA: hypothetical protein PLN48_02450 [Lachnospiraceae bacterium]|nr:hypothetical protein [Lachnospiraceae bacterium]
MEPAEKESSLYRIKEIQKRIALYPDRIMDAQKFRDSIPDVDTLRNSLSSANDGKTDGKDINETAEMLRRYKVSLRMAMNNYESIKKEIEEDEQALLFESTEAKDRNHASITISMEQARQCIIMLELRISNLANMVKSVEISEKALKDGKL